MHIKRIVLIRRIDIDIVSPERCVVSVMNEGQKYSMTIKGMKAVVRINISINQADMDKALLARLELARKVLCFNSFYFDDIELI